MPRIIFIIFFLFTLNSTFSQSLIEDGNQWITSIQTIISPLPVLITSTSERLYEIPLQKADSVHANQNFKKLLLEGELIGLLRESKDSVVYFLPNNATKEQVLYDYSAQTINTSNEELSSLAINAVPLDESPTEIETNLGVVLGGFMELAYNDSENLDGQSNSDLRDKTVSAVFSRTQIN